MGSFVGRVIVSAFALWVTAWLLPGMSVTTGQAGDDTLASVLAFLFLGVVFAVVNLIVKPLVSVLALPLTILTLGLFTLVVNAAMLSLTAWVSQATPVKLGFESFWWTTIPAAVIISVVNMLSSRLLRPKVHQGT